MPPSRVNARSNPTRGFPMKGTDGTLMPVSPAWTKILGLAGFLLLVAMATRTVWAQSPGKDIVADVIVVGNRNIPTEKIMRYIKTRPGAEYLQGPLEAD